MNEKNMDKKSNSKTKVDKKRRDYAIMIVGLTLFVVGIYLIKTIANPRGVMLALPYVAIGVGCGAFGHGLGNLLQRWALKDHPEISKQITIDQNDERNIAVGNRAKAKAHDMMIFVFGALLLSYALMGVDVMQILLLAASYLFVLLYAIYYSVKYDKEM